MLTKHFVVSDEAVDAIYVMGKLKKKLTVSGLKSCIAPRRNVFEISTWTDSFYMPIARWAYLVMALSVCLPVRLCLTSFPRDISKSFTAIKLKPST